MKNLLLLFVAFQIIFANVGKSTNLTDGIYQLGTSPDLTDADLTPLRGILKDAKIVALGESAHTSGGYHHARFGIIKFLVEKMGFRAITLETNWQQALPLTKYLETCEGSLADAMRPNIFGVWWSDAHRDTFEWICEFNKKHPKDKVVFYGFDEEEPARNGKLIRDAHPWTKEELSKCWGAGYDIEKEFYEAEQSGLKYDSNNHKPCLATLAALDKYLKGDQKIALRGIRSFENRKFRCEKESNHPQCQEVRDLGMAERFDLLRAEHFRGKKSIVIAANIHIAEHFPTFYKDNGELYFQRKQMGTALKEKHGNQFAAIGLFAHSIEVAESMQQEQWYAVSTAPNSVETMLSQFGLPYLLVDTRTSLFPPKEDFLFTTGNWKMRPHEQFRAIVYLEHSPAMVMWPERKQP